MTRALQSLTTNLDRAGFFVDLHEQWQQGVGAPERARRELPRGAVVFAIGAFDTYLADMVAEVLVTRARVGVALNSTRDLMKKIQSTVPSLALELILEDNADTRMGRLQHALIVELQNSSWHGATAVAKAMGYIDVPARSVWDAMRDVGFADAPAQLDDWTNKRHRIVHRGEAVRVQRGPARDCIRFIRTLGGVIDSRADEALAPRV